MNEKKLSGLFINCLEAQDSIFESGKMVFQCLSGSDKYSLDYIEITPDKLSISNNYDFYFFNYHIITMSWLDIKSIKKTLPGVKFTMVLEVSPNDPFVFCSPDDFDGYVVLDPTLNSVRENVFTFPRPLEKLDEPLIYQPKDVPVIGSFGFATQGKGFEHIIDAVNREFEKAVVRLNIPYATYADGSRNFAEQLGQICKDKAKNGVEVIVTHDFMTKTELIKWCGQNTLNCFLYDRNMPGLAATTDQAITSGRPLITSKNNTFRHIQKFIKPFPYQSLKNAIEHSEKDVQKIQKEWSAEKFRERFEKVLDKYNFAERTKTEGFIELPLTQSEKGSLNGLIQKAKEKIAVRTRLNNLKNFGTIRREVKPKSFKSVSHSKFGEDAIIKDLFDKIPIKNPLSLEMSQKILNINEIIEKQFTECPDLISIETEDRNLQLLKTFDFEKYNPAVFCLSSTEQIKDVQDFFENKGYFLFQETYANNIFVNKNLYDFYLYQENQRQRDFYRQTNV